MEKIKLKNKLEVSPVIHGHWRLKNWSFSSPELQKLIYEVIDLGITTFDHADIYGNYSCEKIFGDTISGNKSIREKIQVVSKCGIKLNSDKFPERGIKIYDYSKKYIIDSVEKGKALLW